MSARSTENSVHSGLFEIKGGSVNLPSLKLFTGDVPRLIEALRDRIQQAPEFFRDAPVVLDLHNLPEQEEALDLAEFARQLRQCGLVPVGVRGGDAALHRAAKLAHLAVFADVRHEPAPPAPKVPEPKVAEVKPPPRPAEPILTKIVQHPVRSGQRIYAAGGDLVVLAQVSAGAEIMADGNIHVYGALRGRALAGVQGNLNSRIFCMDLQAELVSIAGHYKVSESLDESIGGRPVQIYLNNNALIIEDL